MSDIEKTLMVLNTMTYKLLFNHPKYHWGYDAVKQKFSASYDEFIDGQKSVVPVDMKEDIIAFGIVKKPEGLEIEKENVGGVSRIKFGINLNELDLAVVDKKAQEYIAKGVFETPDEAIKMAFDGITRGTLRPSVTMVCGG